MSLKTKIKTFFFLDDEYVDEYDDIASEPNERQALKSNKQQPMRQNVVSLQSVQKSSKLVLCEPKYYREAQEIADHLKNRRGIVVNLQRCEQGHARQIIDFLSGTVYALGGDIQKIGAEIFLCTPDNVEVTGNISDLLDEQQLQDKRW